MIYIYSFGLRTTYKGLGPRRLLPVYTDKFDRMSADADVGVLSETTGEAKPDGPLHGVIHNLAFLTDNESVSTPLITDVARFCITIA